MTHHPVQFGARWHLRALAVVLAATAFLLGAATAAEAHNVLVGTSPTGGSILAIGPTQVTLSFDQPALAVGTEIIVMGPAGQEQSGAAVLVNNTVSEHLRRGSPAGRYTVLWRVTSADGHTVSGQFSFTATSPSPGHQTTATTSPPASTASTAAPTQLWVAAGGVVVLLLLVVFVIARGPRTTPHDERDPKS
jgi:copper resistance protein C